jgi:hypothetical protein
MNDEPVYIYDHENWDFTFSWAERNDFKESMRAGEVKEFAVFTPRPMWAACVDRGDYDDLLWFDTEAEARAALAPKGEAE